MYYILTSKKKNKILATKSYEESAEFIIKYKDSKIRTLEAEPKLRILDKRVFLKAYYKNTENKNKFFELAELMVKGSTNLYDLMNLLELREDYKNYKNNIDKIP